ncbi:MAG: prepilin-type N-terminal cleavage/methylation domain-containing protein [Planctomycetota bacterium]
MISFPTPAISRRTSLLRAKQSRATGYTLLEMLFVMVLMGIIMGIGVAGFDRMDPGFKGLQSTVETFLESSRDRARTSGHPVTVMVVDVDKEQGSKRLRRFVYRRSMEATFEPRFRGREDVVASGAAGLETTGRYGTGIDLREGGSITVAGRGNPQLEHGFSLDFDLEALDSNGGELLRWEGLLDMRVRKNGVLAVSLRAGNGGDELFQDVLIESPVGTLQPNRWQHIKLVAADGSAALVIDGKEVKRVAIPPVLGSPREAARFGHDSQGWRGRLDEFTVWARVAESGPELPIDVKLTFGSDKVNFDRYGTLDPKFHSAGVPVRLEVFDEEIASFVIGRFTQEIAQ